MGKWEWLFKERKERNHLLILIVFFILLLIVWQLLPRMLAEPSLAISDELAIEINSFLEEGKNAEKDGTLNSPTHLDSKSTPGVLFRFDPNSASESDFLKLGLPIRTVKSILKYREKGGRFYKKEDFSKIYTLDAKDFQRLLPYIDIVNTSEKKTYTAYESPKEAFMKSGKKIEINSAEIADWMLLKGIGEGYSKRIVNYRTALGGFLSVDQVAEVYGLPDSVFQQIKPYLSLNPEVQIQRIKINSATEEELAAHPYIRKFMAANILKLRNDIQKFQSLEDLRHVPLINEEKYRKIAPYLVID